MTDICHDEPTFVSQQGQPDENAGDPATARQAEDRSDDSHDFEEEDDLNSHYAG
ncbi:MAG: hypothetical protein KW802_02545 [Candidatus Doudnabacteria bacterium]|nr:hypothetical protein [Candidatus Doudnabacteria bacterium]